MASRTDEIVDAAGSVFLRYGFKKTSMDELARAAGLSRQGLYLHWKTKEALFEAAVRRLVSVRGEQHRAALGRTELDLEARLLGAFEAIHAGDVVESQHMDELLEAARRLVGSLVHDLEVHFIAAVTTILSRSGVTAHWKHVGITAKELAETLYATSSGLKHSSRADYRSRMKIAIKLVVNGSKRR